MTKTLAGIPGILKAETNIILKPVRSLFPGATVNVGARQATPLGRGDAQECELTAHVGAHRSGTLCVGGLTEGRRQPIDDNVWAQGRRSTTSIDAEKST